MPVIVPLLLVSLILAAVAIVQSRRQRHSVTLRVAPKAKPIGKHVSSLVRTGLIGDGVLGDPFRATARIAPADAPGLALEIIDLAGQVVAAADRGRNGHGPRVVQRARSPGLRRDAS